MTEHGPTELFRPDRFSDPLPRFTKVSNAVFESIHHQLPADFLEQSGGVREIASVGAFELNSRNFRIKAERGAYLLKLTPTGQQGALSGTSAERLVWLKGQGLPVVPPVTLNGAEPAVFEANWLPGSHNISLFDFVEGEYFSGNRPQIFPLAQQIGRLFVVLARLPDHLSDTSERHYLTGDDKRVFDAFQVNRGLPVRWFDAEIASGLEHSRHEVVSVWRSLADSDQAIFSMRRQVVHMDLHPHNLLFSGDKAVAILDMDSLAIAPLGIAFGFAAYKLLRQGVVCNGFDNKEDICGMVDEFRAGLMEELPDAAPLIEDVGTYARAEIMRRLIIVFRLNLEHNDSSWNSVVPMHLAALKEIDLLFGTRG
jgi:Ser/Thr protein kinase RdoA (MazF antagonist)